MFFWRRFLKIINFVEDINEKLLVNKFSILLNQTKTKMKKTITLTAFFCSVVSFAQVGINTTSPAGTLDIAAKSATGGSTAVDGLLVPRVDRQRAQNMTNITTSTMIYINSISTGTLTGTAANIDSVGFYYFNGTVWAKLDAPPINVYNSNGTLTGNRVVTQGANTLAFNGTSTNAFSVDGSTLSVDAADDRVGIGTTSPSNKLVVRGINAQPSALGITNTNATFRIDGNTNHSLDFGTLLGSPYGSYISSHDKTSTNELPLALNPSGGNVGIGMIPSANTSSTTTSKLYLNTAATAPSTGVATLVRDETSGEIMAVRVGTNTKSFNRLTYNINNVQGDFLSDFDTRIPAADYTVIITGIKFGGGTSNDARGLRVSSAVPAGSTYTPLNFSATVQSGTWRLAADYDGGNPPSGVNGNWTINVLIINNSLIKTLTDQTFDLGGTTTGAAATSPAGLNN